MSHQSTAMFGEFRSACHEGRLWDAAELYHRCREAPGLSIQWLTYADQVFDMPTRLCWRLVEIFVWCDYEAGQCEHTGHWLHTVDTDEFGELASMPGLHGSLCADFLGRWQQSVGKAIELGLNEEEVFCFGSSQLTLNVDLPLRMTSFPGVYLTPLEVASRPVPGGLMQSEAWRLNEVLDGTYPLVYLGNEMSQGELWCLICDGEHAGYMGTQPEGDTDEMRLSQMLPAFVDTLRRLNLQSSYVQERLHALTELLKAVQCQM